jgi:hypothetical protein
MEKTAGSYCFGCKHNDAHGSQVGTVRPQLHSCCCCMSFLHGEWNCTEEQNCIVELEPGLHRLPEGIVGLPAKWQRSESQRDAAGRTLRLPLWRELPPNNGEEEWIKRH